MFVPAKSRMTWVGDFGSWAFDTISTSDAVAQVSAYLKRNYNLVVEKFDDNIGYMGLGAGSVTLYLLTNMDRGGSSDGLEDIRGNVNDAWSNATTSFGSSMGVGSSRITSYTLAPATGAAIGPGAMATPSVTVDTGAPGGVGGQSDSSNDSGSSSSWSDWLNKLEGGAIGGTVGLVIGGAVVIGLVVYLSVSSAPARVAA